MRVCVCVVRANYLPSFVVSPHTTVFALLLVLCRKVMAKLAAKQKAREAEETAASAPADAPSPPVKTKKLA